MGYGRSIGNTRNRRFPSRRYVAKSSWSTVRITFSDSRLARWTSVASAKSIGRSQYRDINVRSCGNSASSIVPSMSAPDRTNFHAESTSERLSPTRWNNSVRTACEVRRGSRIWRNAFLQGSCHRSLRSRSARIAPVSITALVRMASA